MTFFFIDFQGFYDLEGNLIVKELCILNSDDTFFHHTIYNTPKNCILPNLQIHVNNKYAKSNQWLTTHFHHLNINDGEREYYLLLTDIQKILKYEPEVIFTCGLPKVLLIQSLLTNHHKPWSGVNMLYNIDIGIPIVDLTNNYSTNNCFEEYEHLSFPNLRYLLDRYFKCSFYNNCIYHASQHCALFNANLIRLHVNMISYQ